MGASARAQSVNLNCVDSQGKQAGRATFDERAGTAGFTTKPPNDVPVSPAKFTDSEITWDYDYSNTVHHFFTLNRTTGSLIAKDRRGRQVWEMTCTVAKKKF